MVERFAACGHQASVKSGFLGPVALMSLPNQIPHHRRSLVDELPGALSCRGGGTESGIEQESE